ncbi:MAG TPA: hypothetical protein VLG50_00040 [Candidatus Saccharimonadales bacterium]|nr:hypothetical protein [Candidatus Saccharimonadales bacterium]
MNQTSAQQLHDDMQNAFDLSKVPTTPKHFIPVTIGEFFKIAYEHPLIRKIRDEQKSEIELCKNAAQMFKNGTVAKKRPVIDMITSNCTYKNGNIDIELKPVLSAVLKSAETENWCAR